MQCEVDNSEHQKLFKCWYWIYAAIWIPARVSQCTDNGSQNFNNWSTWLWKVIITMSLKSDCTRRRELERGGGDKTFSAPLSNKPGRFNRSKSQKFNFSGAIE
jgi:hypothetical protein